CACIANACFHVGDRARDTRNHAGAVLGDRQELDGVRRLLRPSGPLNFDDSLAIDHQLLHVLTARGVDRHALAARDVANHLFAVKRVTATRARHHQIVDAADDDRIVAQTNETFDGANTAPEPRLLLLVELLKLLWSKILRDDVAWNQLAVSDRGQQIVDAPVT